MIGIYKITNPKGKVYIGQSVNIEKRFFDYSPLKIKVKSQIKLYNSLNKYSPNNHVFEIIDECSINYLNEKERYWQEFYNSIEDGLNCRYTKTNDKSGYMSLESKLKMSNSRIGKPQTIEHKTKITNSKIGRKLSEDTKKKISDSHLKIDKEIKSKCGKKPIGWNFSKESKLKMSENSKKRKIILDKYTGVYYYSLSELCILFNYNSVYMSERLRGRFKNNTNYIYA